MKVEAESPSLFCGSGCPPLIRGWFNCEGYGVYELWGPCEEEYIPYISASRGFLATCAYCADGA